MKFGSSGAGWRSRGCAYRPAALACQQLHELPAYGPAPPVAYPPGDGDPLAQRLAGVLPGQVAVQVGDVGAAEDGAVQLGGVGVGERQRRAVRVAQDGAAVRGEVAGRVVRRGGAGGHGGGGGAVGFGDLGRDLTLRQG